MTQQPADGFRAIARALNHGDGMLWYRLEQLREKLQETTGSIRRVGELLGQDSTLEREDDAELPGGS